MATKFIPEIKPGTVIRKTEASISNPPEKGTLMRATLGRTVIYGKFIDAWRDLAIGVAVEGHQRLIEDGITLWFGDGWQFEILDEED